MRIFVFLRAPALLLLMALLSACGSIGYYAQAARGHLDLLSRREPIERLLQDAGLDPTLREQLQQVLSVRAFASESLGLPDNDSYRTYADLGREYVVWNVFAAPELSVTPYTWCFPVVGCISYKGYFNEQSAREVAAELSQQGYDVYVGGVAAYSTLGRFDDPFLNTMLRWDRARTAGLIFHELSHQLLYIKNDSAFNEAFATTVEEEGMRRWVRAIGEPELLENWRTTGQRTRSFVRMVSDARETLRGIYQGPMDDAAKRVAKAQEIAALRSRYEALKQRWGGYAGYDRWFASDLNNAKLGSVATYRALVPAFSALLQESDGDLQVFYTAAQALGKLPPAARAARLRALMAVVDTPAAPSAPGGSIEPQ